MDLPSVSQTENTKRKKKRILIDEGSKSIIIRRPPKISWEILDKKRESQRVDMKSKIHPKRLLKHSNFASRVLSELIGRNMIMSRDDKKEMENLDKLLFLESNDTAKMQRNTAEHIHCTRAEMIEGDNSNTGICSVELAHTQTAENVNNNSSPKRQSSLIDKSYFAKPPLGSETEIWKNYSTPLIKPSEGLDKVKVNLFPPRVVVRDSLSPILSLSSDEDKCDVDSDDQDEAISNLREDDTNPATKEQGKENVLEEVKHSFSPVMTENNSFLHKEDGEQSTSRSEDVTSPKHHSTEHHSPQGSKNKRRKFSKSNNESYEDYTTGLSNQMNKNDLNEEKRSTSPVLEAGDGEVSTSESEDATSPKQYPTEHRSSSNRKKKRRKFSKSNRENREDSAAGGSSKQSKARQFSVGPTGTEKVLSFILTERDDDLSGTKVVIADLHNHKSLYKHLRHIKHDDSSSEE